jgi:hypothetical protein
VSDDLERERLPAATTAAQAGPREPIRWLCPP